MEILILAPILGLITAAIAKSKGRSFFLWWIYGALLFIIALIHILLVSPKDVKKCPACAETVKAEAKICKHCQTKITPITSKPKKKESINSILLFIILVIIGTVAALYIWPV